MEEFFDPLTKTLITHGEPWQAHNEHNLALGEQTLRAIDWKNQELDKQTKAIKEAGSQMTEHGERGFALDPPSTSQIRETGERDKTEIKRKYFPLDTNTANIIHLMLSQSNSQLKLHIKNINKGEFTMNGVTTTLEQGVFLVKYNIYDFTWGLINSLTNSDVRYNDIEEDETIIKRFLHDVRYDIETGDKKNSRYRTIKHILRVKYDEFVKGLTKDKLDYHSCNFADSLIER